MVEGCDVVTKPPTTVGYYPLIEGTVSGAGGASCSGGSVQNINHRSVRSGGGCHLDLRVWTPAGKRKRINMVRPVGAIVAVVIIVAGKPRYRVIRATRIARVNERRSYRIVSTRNGATGTVISCGECSQTIRVGLMRQQKLALPFQQSARAEAQVWLGQIPRATADNSSLRFFRLRRTRDRQIRN